MGDKDYQGFNTDEKMAEFLQKLEQAQSKQEQLAKEHQQQQSRLSQAETATTEAAADMALKETQLASACQALETSEKQLTQQKRWQQELEKDSRLKAYTLTAAQKAVEDALRRLENQEKRTQTMSGQIAEQHQEIDRYTKNIKLAYNEWQAKNQMLEGQRQRTSTAAAKVNTVQSVLGQLQQAKAAGENQAAEAIAQMAISSYQQNLQIKDLPVSPLPQVTVNPQDLEVISQLLAEQTEGGVRPTPDAEFAKESSPPLPANPELANIIAEVLEQPPAPKPQVADKQAQSGLSTQALGADQTEVTAPPLRNTDFWDKPTKAEKKAAKKAADPSLAPSAQPLPQTAVEEDNQPGQPPTESEHPKTKTRILTYVICVVLALVLAFGIREYVFQITKISGDSMNPTLVTEDRVFTSSVSYYFNQPEPGDIVVFPAPDRIDKAPYIKRVIGIAGDHLVIKDGVVTINDQFITEPYLAEPETLGEVDTIVPEGQVFVMGDNRAVSHDSRADTVSFIKVEDIISKAVFRLYPFDKMGDIY